MLNTNMAVIFKFCFLNKHWHGVQLLHHIQIWMLWWDISIHMTFTPQPNNGKVVFYVDILHPMR